MEIFHWKFSFLIFTPPLNSLVRISYTVTLLCNQLLLINCSKLILIVFIFFLLNVLLNPSNIWYITYTTGMALQNVYPKSQSTWSTYNDALELLCLKKHFTWKSFGIVPKYPTPTKVPIFDYCGCRTWKLINMTRMVSKWINHVH